MLEKPPAKSDNSDALITVNASAINSLVPVPSHPDDGPAMASTRKISLANARFSKARVGSSFPLCCPQHPLISRFDAQTAKDLDLGFCQVICDEELMCSHSCGLKCHWPKTKHNGKCKVLVDSPCSKHMEMIQCLDVYKNTSATQQSSIDEALEQYQCPAKVIVTLPCSHEEEMPCWKEDEIANGKDFPKCNKPSPRPYVYPDCGHKVDLTCAKLEQYSNNGNLAKPCAELVEYRPSNCTHVKTIKCYLEKEYRSGLRDFVCPEKLTIVLPRCGHEVKNISCGDNVILESWTGCKAEEVGIVREGVQYGPKDYNCKKISKFVRSCGHEEKVTCGKAFEMTEMTDLDVQQPCLIRVPVTHPHCGHRIEVACTIKEKLENVGKLTDVPINEVHQGASSFPDNLPRGIGRCTQLVMLHRSCGHKHEVACGSARGTLTRCKEEVRTRR